MSTLPRTPASALRTLFVSLALAILLANAAQPRDAGWQQEIATWRAQHAVDLQNPDGWLALAGLEWLEPGDNSFGAAKDNKIHLPASGPTHMGVLHLDGDAITLNAPAGGFP